MICLGGYELTVNSLVVFYMWYYGDGHERARNIVYELSEGCGSANFENKNKVRTHHNRDKRTILYLGKQNQISNDEYFF